MKQEQLELLRAALASRYRVERELGQGGMATVYLAARWERRMAQSRGTLNGLEMDRAAALVRLGDRERALELLAEGIGRRYLPTAVAGWDGHAYPEFAALWSDQRFKALIKPRG